MRVLLTRPEKEGRRTAAQLAALGHEPVLAPLIRIVGTPATIPDEPFDGLVVTSVQALNTPGAPVIPERLLKTPFFCVGGRAAEAAAQLGFKQVEPAAPTAADLVMLLSFAVRKGGKLLYLAGRERKPDLEIKLGQFGIAPIVIEAYEARAVDKLPDNAHDALWDGRIEAVLHFSRRSAELFVDLAQRAGVAAPAARARHCAISSDSAEPLRDFTTNLRVARTPNSRSLFDCLDG